MPFSTVSPRLIGIPFSGFLALVGCITILLLTVAVVREYGVIGYTFTPILFVPPVFGVVRRLIQVGIRSPVLTFLVLAFLVVNPIVVMVLLLLLLLVLLWLPILCGSVLMLCFSLSTVKGKWIVLL
jgi:hypothetical protein